MFITFSLNETQDIELHSDGGVQLYPKGFNRTAYPGSWMTVSYPYEAWGALLSPSVYLKDFRESLAKELDHMQKDAEKSIENRLNDLDCYLGDLHVCYSKCVDGSYLIDFHIQHYACDENETCDDYSSIIVRCSADVFALLEEYSDSVWHEG